MEPKILEEIKKYYKQEVIEFDADFAEVIRRGRIKVGNSLNPYRCIKSAGGCASRTL
jgi:hypothetical protein